MTRAPVLALILLLLTPVGVEAKPRPCDYHPKRGPWHRHQLARCYHERIQPPGTWAYVHSIMDCETSHPAHWDPAPGDWRTRPGHSGPMQQAHAWWDSRYRHYTKPSHGLVNNPGHFRTNIVVSYRMARAKGTWAIDWACA